MIAECMPAATSCVGVISTSTELGAEPVLLFRG
jgi:hypothetical protein